MLLRLIKNNRSQNNDLQLSSKNILTSKVGTPLKLTDKQAEIVGKIKQIALSARHNQEVAEQPKPVAQSNPV